MDGGASVAQIAAASSEAAEGALSRASADPALIRAFWLLTQLPLAARQIDFTERLSELGLEVGSSPQLFDIIGAFSEAVDAHAHAVSERSDIGEMAQLAAAESLSAIIGRSLSRLFGPTSEEVQHAFARRARALLTQAVEAEVAEFLAKHTDLKIETGQQRVMRRGHLPNARS